MPNGLGYWRSHLSRDLRFVWCLQRHKHFLFWSISCVVLFLTRPLAAAPVGKADAEAMAKGWLADQQPHLASHLRPEVKSVESFSGFHVVYLQPKGFIITAADDEVEPVLAFSDQGNFKYDPENPLCELLAKDVPARTENLRNARARVQSGQTRRASPAAAKADEAVLTAAQRANEKWQRYKLQGSLPVLPIKRAGKARANSPTNSVSDADEDSSFGEPVPIQSMQIVNGHIQLTHDSLESVTVYSSYDGGKTWQVEDSGIVWPTWTSKRPAQETACVYRIATDGIYDAFTVDLMRHPPAVTELPEIMTNSDVSDPGGTGLVGSVMGVSDVRVSPLVQSTWNQSTEQGANCYNYYTPNNDVCGCVATCMSQLMRYWQYPNTAIGRVTRTIYNNGAAMSVATRGGDGSGGAYNWAAMPLSPSGISYNAAQWQMIGALTYDAGVSVNMQYSPGGSGTYMYLGAGAFTGIFHYSNAKYINSPSNLLLPVDSNLAAGYPVLFGISSSGRNGHAVVCDGFGYDTGTLYHHINMGWDGAYNYWYALPYLETPYGFNSIDTIVYNVFPSGSGELLTGRCATSQGAPVTAAAVTATGGGQTYNTTTDSKGYYAFKVPSATSYAVTASKVGMNTGTRSGVMTGTSGTSGAGNLIGMDFAMNNNFALTAVGLTNSVWLRWTVPTNSGMANNTVYIRSRTDRYPTNSTDGSLIYSGTAQAYEHTGVDTSGNVTNYYSIWGDDGSGGYVTIGGPQNAASLADPGTVRMLWTRVTGEVYLWNLKTNGMLKSSVFVTSTPVDPTVWKIVGFNDIDGDGHADILWMRSTGEVLYWLLNVDGTLRTSGFVTPGNATRGGYYQVAGFRDINGDGTADILFTGGSGGEVGYWLLNADGSLKSSGAVTTGNATRSGYYKASGFADINGDGSADVLWTGGSGGEVGFWLLNASGTLKTAGAVTSGNATRSGYYTASGFADINGDGTADVLWTGPGGETGYWMLNANGTLKSSGSVSATKMTPGTYWKASGFADMNGDGVPDIVWRGQGGETAYWALNSNGSFKSSNSIGGVLVSPSTWTLRGIGR